MGQPQRWMTPKAVVPNHGSTHELQQSEGAEDHPAGARQVKEAVHKAEDLPSFADSQQRPHRRQDSPQCPHSDTHALISLCQSMKQQIYMTAIISKGIEHVRG